MQNTVSTVSTFLWFESNAHEAARFYCETFPSSKITATSPMTASFEIDGQRYIAFNGGPHYKLTAAVSLSVPCSTQEEIDTLWDRFISSGGKETQCGWLEDKFGLSWQILPKQLPAMLEDPDRVKADRVMQVMMPMKKLDLAALQRAYAGD